MEAFHRFPLAFILILIISLIWFLDHLRPLDGFISGFFQGETEFFLAFAASICCLNVAFRLRSETGRLFGSLSKGLLYGIFALWFIWIFISLHDQSFDAGNSALLALQVTPILLLFPLPFIGDQDDRTLVRFTLRSLSRLLISGLLAFLGFNLIMLLLIGLESIGLYPPYAVTPDTAGALFFMLLWPLLFLADLPNPAQLPEEETKWERRIQPVFRILLLILLFWLTVDSAYFALKAQQGHAGFCLNSIIFAFLGMILLLLFAMLTDRIRSENPPKWVLICSKALPIAMLTALSLVLFGLWRSFFLLSLSGNGVRFTVFLIWCLFACLLLLKPGKHLFRNLLFSLSALFFALNLYLQLPEIIASPLLKPWIASTLKRSPIAGFPKNEAETQAFLAQFKPSDHKFCEAVLAVGSPLYPGCGSALTDHHRTHTDPEDDPLYKPMIETCKAYIRPFED